MKKVLVVITLSLILIWTNLIVVQATLLDDIINGAIGFVNSPETASHVSTTQSRFSPVVISLSQVGIAIGLIVLIVAGLIIGIKFMIGGAEGKADLKASLTPYVFSAIILFGAFAIWSTMVKIMERIFA